MLSIRKAKTDLLNEAHSLALGARSIFEDIINDLESAVGSFGHVADAERATIATAEQRLAEATEAATTHQTLADKVKGLLS